MSIESSSAKDHPWVIYFKDEDQYLILKDYHKKTILPAYGEETDDWKDQRLILSVKTMRIKDRETGQPKDISFIDVEVPADTPRITAKPDFDDEVPF